MKRKISDGQKVKLVADRLCVNDELITLDLPYAIDKQNIFTIAPLIPVISSDIIGKNVNKYQGHANYQSIDSVNAAIQRA